MLRIKFCAESKFCASKSASSPSAKTLATSVKTKDNRNDIFNNETTKYINI